MTALPGDGHEWLLGLLRSEEREDEHRRETSELLLALLEVMDSFDRVLGQEPAPGDSPSDTSCRLIARQLGAVLERVKVRPMQAVGKRVDVEIHEVVGVRVTAPEQADMIVEVVRQGYEWDGRLLRTAQVIVGRGSEEVST